MLAMLERQNQQQLQNVMRQQLVQAQLNNMPPNPAVMQHNPNNIPQNQQVHHGSPQISHNSPRISASIQQQQQQQRLINAMNSSPSMSPQLPINNPMTAHNLQDIKQQQQNLKISVNNPQLTASHSNTPLMQPSGGKIKIDKNQK